MVTAHIEGIRYSFIGSVNKLPTIPQQLQDRVEYGANGEILRSPFNPETTRYLLDRQEVFEFFLQALDKYFDAEGHWKGPEQTISARDIHNVDNVKEIFTFFVKELAVLYDVAEVVLNYDIPGIAQHDIHHILRAVSQGLSLLQQTVEPSNQTGKHLSTKELFIFLMTLVFHDSAQAFDVRKVHAQQGARVVEAALHGEDDTAAEAIIQISQGVAGHVSEKFGEKPPIDSLAFFAAVLGDELDIYLLRTGEIGLNGLNNKDWADFNRHTMNSQMVLDADGSVVWKLTHNLVNSQEIQRYKDLCEQLVVKKKRDTVFGACIEGIYGKMPETHSRRDFRVEFLYGQMKKGPTTTNEYLEMVHVQIDELRPYLDEEKKKQRPRITHVYNRVREAKAS
jgi:hypothetical protein